MNFADSGSGTTSGRRRNVDAWDAILASTRNDLADRGYDQMSIERIASAAGSDSKRCTGVPVEARARRRVHCALWVAQLATGLSATNVLRCYGVLASILDRAVKDRRLAANPARGVNLPRKTRKAWVYLTHERVDLLACEAREHLAPFVPIIGGSDRTSSTAD